MEKNLLSDTDYTKGWDNRFGVTAVIGKVSKIEVSDKGANVRIIMPDRLDHDDNPLISKPIPVLQVASKAKKSFAVPRQGDNVLLVKLPNGTSNYAVIGSFYTSKDPPPVTDPNLDYVLYDDGSTMQFDASTGELTWKIKGDLLLENEKDFTIKQQGDFNVETEGNVSVKPQGDMDLLADGDVHIQGGTIKLTGPLRIEGDIEHYGNMRTFGIHQDNVGFHVGGTANTQEWKWTSDTVDASSAGDVGLNATTWEAATELHLSMVTSDGMDVTPAFPTAFAEGNDVYVQSKSDSTRYGRYRIISPATQTGGWWTVPVQRLQSNGMPPPNNALTIVTAIQSTEPFLTRLHAVERRIAELEARNGN